MKAIKSSKSALNSSMGSHFSAEQIALVKEFSPGFSCDELTNGVFAFRIRRMKFGKRHVITLGKSDVMTLQQAAQKAMEINSLLERGFDPQINKRTLNSFARRLLRELENSNVKKYLEFKSRLKAIPEYVIEMPVIDITSKHIRDALDQLQKNTGIKNSTRNRIRSFLSVVFGYAIDKGASIENPCSKVKVMPERNTRTNTIPPSGIPYYTGYLLKDSNWLAAYSLIIMVSTGIRCGNVIAMTVDMVSPCLRYIHLPMTKSGKPQTVAVPLQLRPILQELLDNARKKNSHFLFPSDTSSTGHIASPRGPHERAIAALNAMGFNVICTIHDLRRTFANQLLRASGGNVYLVSQALGHGSVAVTMRYLSIRSDELDEAVNLAAAALGLESLAA